jgi:hypothetical protein
MLGKGTGKSNPGFTELMVKKRRLTEVIRLCYFMHDPKNPVRERTMGRRKPSAYLSTKKRRIILVLGNSP